MKRIDWTEEMILENYKKLCEEKGDIINTGELRNYPELPCYQTAMKFFDDIYELRYKAGVYSKKEYESIKSNGKSELSEEELEARKRDIMCEDCIENRWRCNRDREECYREAQEEGYFEYAEKFCYMSGNDWV